MTAISAGVSFDYETAANMATGVTFSGTTTAVKKELIAPEEHNILNRCFGGVKYMSNSHSLLQSVLLFPATVTNVAIF